MEPQQYGQGAPQPPGGSFNPMFDDSQFTRGARKQPHSLGNADKNRTNLSEVKEGGGLSPPGAAGSRKPHHHHSNYRMHQHTTTAPLGGGGHPGYTIPGLTGYSAPVAAHAAPAPAAPSPAGPQPVAGVRSNERVITENVADVERRMMADLQRQQQLAAQQQQAGQPDIFDQEYAQVASSNPGLFGGGALRANAYGVPASQQHHTPQGPVQDADFDF